jgi:hypothetical protein
MRYLGGRRSWGASFSTTKALRFRSRAVEQSLERGNCHGDGGAQGSISRTPRGLCPTAIAAEVTLPNKLEALLVSQFYLASTPQLRFSGVSGSSLVNFRHSSTASEPRDCRRSADVLISTVQARPYHWPSPHLVGWWSWRNGASAAWKTVQNTVSFTQCGPRGELQGQGSRNTTNAN